jgi:hypothetical protein
MICFCSILYGSAISLAAIRLVNYLKGNELTVLSIF